jgi:hypothetical protein
MTRLNEVSRDQICGIADTYLDKLAVRNEDLVIGNKIVKAKRNSRLKTMSVYKDLFLRTCEPDVYISLTDANGFNRRIKDTPHDNLYYMTNRVALPFKSIDMDRLGIANIENLFGYGFEDKYIDYDKAIKLLKRMNRYLQAKVTANLVQYYGASLKTTKSGIVVFHDDNIDSVNDSITTDLSTGLSLTRKFEK